MAEQKQESINNSIKTSVGKVIDVFLPSMVASSGSDWFLANLEGGLVLIDIRREYISSDIYGPVRDSFRFLAVESGSYKLAFNSMQLNSSSPSRADRREVIQVMVSDKEQQASSQDLSSNLSNDKFVPLSSIMEYQQPIVPYGFPNGLGDNIIPYYGFPRPLYGIVPVYGIPVYGIPENNQNGVPMPKYGVIRPFYGVDFPPNVPIRPLYGIPPVLPYGVPPWPVYGVAIPPDNGGLVIALYGVPINSNGIR